MICFCSRVSVGVALTIYTRSAKFKFPRQAGAKTAIEHCSYDALTCSGLSHVWMGSFTILPSLCYVTSVATYIFHGSSLRFRIPMLFRSLLWSCLSSAVDRNLGPLMPVLLVCAFVSVIVFTYGGVLQQPELVRVDRVLLPHLLSWLDVRSVPDLPDEVVEVLLAR